MGLFSRKPKIVREIHDGAWGHLAQDHHVNVDELSKDIRCVEKSGLKDGSQVTLMRVFSLRDIGKKGVTVDNWETFDQHPELIMFEGYLDDRNQAHLERKNGQKAG